MRRTILRFTTLAAVLALIVPAGVALASHVRIGGAVTAPAAPTVIYAPAPPATSAVSPTTLRADEIKADQVRAHTIYANSIKADTIQGKVFRTTGVKIHGGVGDIKAPEVTASIVYADEITANSVVADTIYVRKLKNI